MKIQGFVIVKHEQSYSTRENIAWIQHLLWTGMSYSCSFAIVYSVCLEQKAIASSLPEYLSDQEEYTSSFRNGYAS